ncbi:MAG: rhodanese [Proteobacteria bacterium]|nr:rhodanese [Pseudomonadota bacterium]
MMRKILAVLSVLFLATVFSTARANDDPFPHRAKFKHVPIMSPEALHRDLDKVILVDVRSGYEFQTLHIKGALHIPLSKEKLPAAVKELRAKSSSPIVFYCNGNSCKKSYEAADLAINAGVTDVHAYDSGLDTWTKQYPDKSVLLGKSPMNPADLISSDSFKKRIISAEEFEARLEKGAVVLDVRDIRQRDVVLFPMRELRTSDSLVPVLSGAAGREGILLSPWRIRGLLRGQVREAEFQGSGAVLKCDWVMTRGATAHPVSFTVVMFVPGRDQPEQVP